MENTIEKKTVDSIFSDIMYSIDNPDSMKDENQTKETVNAYNNINWDEISSLFTGVNTESDIRGVPQKNELHDQFNGFVKYKAGEIKTYAENHPSDSKPELLIDKLSAFKQSEKDSTKANEATFRILIQLYKIGYFQNLRELVQATFELLPVEYYYKIPYSIYTIYNNYKNQNLMQFNKLDEKSKKNILDKMQDDFKIKFEFPASLQIKRMSLDDVNDAIFRQIEISLLNINRSFVVDLLINANKDIILKDYFINTDFIKNQKYKIQKLQAELDKIKNKEDNYSKLVSKRALIKKIENEIKSIQKSLDEVQNFDEKDFLFHSLNRLLYKNELAMRNKEIKINKLIDLFYAVERWNEDDLQKKYNTKYELQFVKKNTKFYIHNAMYQYVSKQNKLQNYLSDPNVEIDNSDQFGEVSDKSLRYMMSDDTSTEEKIAFSCFVSQLPLPDSEFSAIDINNEINQFKIYQNKKELAYLKYNLCYDADTAKRLLKTVEETLTTEDEILKTNESVKYKEAPPLYQIYQEWSEKIKDAESIGTKNEAMSIRKYLEKNGITINNAVEFVDSDPNVWIAADMIIAQRKAFYEALKEAERQNKSNTVKQSIIDSFYKNNDSFQSMRDNYKRNLVIENDMKNIMNFYDKKAAPLSELPSNTNVAASTETTNADASTKKTTEELILDLDEILGNL